MTRFLPPITGESRLGANSYVRAVFQKSATGTLATPAIAPLSGGVLERMASELYAKLRGGALENAFGIGMCQTAPSVGPGASVFALDMKLGAAVGQKTAAQLAAALDDAHLGLSLRALEQITQSTAYGDAGERSRAASVAREEQAAAAANPLDKLLGAAKTVTIAVLVIAGLGAAAWLIHEAIAAKRAVAG